MRSGEFRFTGAAGWLITSSASGCRASRRRPTRSKSPTPVKCRREYRLSRIETTLPEVPVTASLLDRKLLEFHERRRFGIGRFLDSAEFANTRGTRTADRLLTAPRTHCPPRTIQRCLRGEQSPDPAQGAQRKLCKSAVWLDDVNLGTDFNVNELDPSLIVAIEWYAGQASIPARFNVPPRPGQPYCGVLVIWTR